MSDSEWMRQHKGAHIKTVGMVWECGDDFCGCTQAVVVDYFKNKTDSRWRVPVGVWEGTFFTDDEPGADAELAKHRREMKESDPEREAAIEWQQGIDYGEHE